MFEILQDLCIFYLLDSWTGVSMYPESPVTGHLRHKTPRGYAVFKLSLFPSSLSLFLIGIVGGGVQLGPLGTAATNRVIVSAPGDYDDGEIG
jgi:hypothetical protein